LLKKKVTFQFQQDMPIWKHILKEKDYVSVQKMRTFIKIINNFIDLVSMKLFSLFY
jgi:hypothetical protein